MKKLALIALLFIGCGGVSSIAQDTTYFDAGWKEATPDKARYFKTRLKTDSGWLVKTYSSGNLITTGVYLDDSLKVPQGVLSYYDGKGHRTRLVTYNKGQEEGKEIYYYESGKIRAEGTNQADKAQGEWVAYYPTGQLSGKAVYDADKQVSGSFFKEDGTPNKKVSQFIKESVYHGGDAALYKFLGKTLQYPDEAMKKNIMGTVIVEYRIAVDGRVADIRVVQSVENSLDKEAVRVIGLMPDWEPAMLGGIPINSYKKLPIVFRF